MPGPPVVGVDLSATNLQFGVVDPGGRILGRTHGKTEADGGLDRVIENVIAGVREACAEAGVPVDGVGAVGIAAAGAIDMPRGVILEAPNLGWKDVPLRDLVSSKLGRPVVLDNDVNGAVWGEYKLGAGRGRGDVLGVWVGTGIGGGLVLDETLYHGERHTAGEIGNTVIEPDGAEGERTVEDLCSRTGILRQARARLRKHPDSLLAADPDGAGTAILAEGFEKNDPVLRPLLDRAADLLGIAIANWVTVLSLDTVIVGGGVTEALGEPYLDRIRQSFAADVFPHELATCEIVMTRLAADAGLLGAALLAAEAVD